VIGALVFFLHKHGAAKDQKAKQNDASSVHYGQVESALAASNGTEGDSAYRSDGERTSPASAVGSSRYGGE
jgi:hypothetical protein